MPDHGNGFRDHSPVTEDKWVACGVRDEIKFGLMPGGELKLDTTICHEIRRSGNPVIIDHVKDDEYYNTHHTPAMYGFQSYISVPVILQNGDFFGTLCAIDPKPTLLNTPEIVGMFRSYANLLSLYMNVSGRIPQDAAIMLKDHISAELKMHLHNILQANGSNSGQKEIIIQSTDRINTLLGELKAVS